MTSLKRICLSCFVFLFAFAFAFLFWLGYVKSFILKEKLNNQLGMKMIHVSFAENINLKIFWIFTTNFTG
jgi:hypothetical protein